MKLPPGQLVRSRVVKDLRTALVGALDREVTGYAVLEPRESLLLDESGEGVLTFEGGVPVVAYHTGTDRGGPPALADLAASGPYRLELFALAPADPANQNVLTGHTPPTTENLLAWPPSGLHLFGTDWAGRDILSRIMYGARWSLSIGFIAVAVALFIGVPLGAISGYYGGYVDEVIMRVVDLLYAFPFIVLAIAVIAILGRGYWELVFALIVVGWLAYARILRGEILSVKENEYVTAAKALGATDRSVIVRHILPNAMAPVIVQATLSVGTVVLAAAALGFIGLGLSPASAEWGVMLRVEQDSMARGRWWAGFFPGLAIFVFVLAINLVGDGVRDAFDPQGEGGGRFR